MRSSISSISVRVALCSEIPYYFSVSSALTSDMCQVDSRASLWLSGTIRLFEPMTIVCNSNPTIQLLHRKTCC